MGSEWRTSTVGEVALRVTKGTTPTTLGRDFVDQGINFVKVESISEDGQLQPDRFAHIDEATHSLLARSILQPGDVLFTIAGTIGRVSMVPENILPANTNQAVAIVRPNLEVVLPRFLFYVLGDRIRVRQAHTRIVQSVQANFSLAELSSLEMPLPPLEEQHRIVRILGALDDKIELNRRMSQTLESVARALFKSWFVDFDPVRAKAEGRDAGLTEDLANLFPDSLEDSKLGELPSGWRVSSLGDIATSPRLSVKPAEIDPDTPYIGLEHMPRKSIALVEWGRAESVESGKTAFHRGEILFGKLRPYFHKVGVAPVDGVCSTDIVVVTPKDDAWSGLVLGHASSGEFVDYTNATSSGTKMPRTSWSDMARFPLVEPPAALAAAFTEQIGPAVDRMISSIHEMRTLATVRDLLLPGLVCGRFSLEKSGWPRGGADA